MTHPATVRLLLVLLLVVPSATGCVRKDLHIAALDAIAEARSHSESLAKTLDSCHGSIDQLDEAITQCSAEVTATGAARDELLADNTVLRGQLRALGTDVDALSAERSSLAGLLAESQAALQRARERQKAADARDAIYRRLKKELQSMIEAGKLNVRIVRGRMVIDLKQDILFPSGKAKLSEIGLETIREVAQALIAFAERAFQVEGHTDNVPIKTSRFGSNWELSTARAVAVLKLFVAEGINPTHLSAAGYGEHQPRADNASPEGRTLNRRIEIVMLPDLQVLPDLVDSL